MHCVNLPQKFRRGLSSELQDDCQHDRLFRGSIRSDVGNKGPSIGTIVHDLPAFTRLRERDRPDSSRSLLGTCLEYGTGMVFVTKTRFNAKQCQGRSVRMKRNLLGMFVAIALATPLVAAQQQQQQQSTPPQATTAAPA